MESPSGRIIDVQLSDTANSLNKDIQSSNLEREFDNVLTVDAAPSASDTESKNGLEQINKPALPDLSLQGVDAEMDILHHALSNLNNNTKSHSDISANQKFEGTLREILNKNKKNDFEETYFEKPKLKTSDEFAQIINSHRRDFGPSMEKQMLEVKDYIKTIFNHVREVIRKSKPGNINNSAQTLTALVEEITKLGQMAELKEKQLPLTSKDSAEGSLSDSEINGFLSAITDDEKSPQEERINNEITTGSDFALKPQLSPKDTDDELRKIQELARVNLASSFNFGQKESEDKQIFDDKPVIEEQKSTYIPSLGEVLNEVLNRTQPPSYIRHQNNNTGTLISKDLQVVLDDIYAKKQQDDYEKKILQSDANKNIENKVEIKTETQEAKTESLSLGGAKVGDYSQANHEEHLDSEHDENEYHQEVVGGGDFKSSIFNNKEKNNEKIVDGKPTQDKSYEVSLFEGDNRALGRQMQSSDFYDNVLSFDSWLNDIKAVGFSGGPVYAALSYTSRKIDPVDSSHWILNISSDFTVLAEDPEFLRNITKRFSLLKNRNLRIDYQIIRGIPEGSPEYLAKIEHIKAVQKARDDMSNCREISLLLNHLGEDPQTVNLALYLQLPAPTNLKKN